MVTKQVSLHAVFDEKERLQAVIYRHENSCRHTQVYITREATEEEVAALICNKSESHE